MTDTVDPLADLLDFLLAGLNQLDVDDREEVFAGLRMAFCVFCGRDQPVGGMCECWIAEPPTGNIK